MSPERVIAYIDGYNLYFGLLDARLQTSRWLDLHGVCTSLLKPGQRLELVRYFTTSVRNDPDAAKRQATFIDALRATGGIEIDFGVFLSKTMTCRSCNAQWTKNDEPEGSDVNIVGARVLNACLAGTTTLIRSGAVAWSRSSGPYASPAKSLSTLARAVVSSRFRYCHAIPGGFQR